MKYEKIIKAAPALGELKRLRLPYATARDIYTAHKTLEAEFSFYLEEERKLVSEFAVKDENGNPKITSGGFVSFSNIAERNKYNERRAELCDMDANIELPTIKLTVEEMGNQLISPETMEALEGIVIFE